LQQVSLISGNVSGPIVGGSLTSLISTLGTPYEIDTTGAIFVLVETHEPINTVYRYLHMLKLAGKFQDCVGIVMGQLSDGPAAYNTTYRDLIDAVLVPIGIPLMINVATGHGYFKAAIPIGAMGNLDTNRNAFQVIESTVR